MKRRRSSETYRKERIIMIAGSVLVLTAMTVTGISIYQNSQPGEQEENIVDFSALEDSQKESTQTQNSDVTNYTSNSESGELDYDPYYAAQDELLNDMKKSGGESESESGASKDSAGGKSGNGAAETESMSENEKAAAGDGSGTVGYAEISGGAVVNQEGAELSTVNGNSLDTQTAADGQANADGQEGSGDQANADGQDGTDAQASADGQSAAADQEALEAVADAVQEEMNLHFGEADSLVWPIVGSVVLNYSMDKTVYFQTLQQYKYNPSIVISAVQGANIACAADGVVKSIYEDPQTGTTVVMNLGDGYELTYGQLTDVCVEEGDFVETGVHIGKVAAPTKYYTKEGTNVYFKLTRDQEPVNPLDYLG